MNSPGQSLSQIIPLRKNTNFAPMKPLLRLGEGARPAGHYLCDALKERFTHFWQKDAAVRREMISVGELVSRFLTGDQLLERNPFTGGWLVIKPQRHDHTTQRAMNMLQAPVTMCASKWMLSNPDIIAKAALDTDAAQMSAKAADTIVGHYESQFYRPWFNWQEVLQAMTFGTYLDRVRYDAGIKGVTGLREIVENRTVTLGEGAGYCGDCGKGGAYAEFTAHLDGAEQVQSLAGYCPQCGSEAVLLDPPAVDEIPSVVGQESVELGDLVCEPLLFAGSWWDMTRRAEQSSWFIYQQKIPLGAVKRLLGNVRIPGNGDEITDIGAQVIRALGYGGQPIAGSSGQAWRSAKDQEDPTLTEMWLSADDYADITLKGDEETVDGEKLPSGASLAELFPNGLCAVGLNSFNVTLGLYAERHADHITSGVWHMRPLSGSGRGLADAIEVQRRLNKLDSQQLAFMDASATPGVLYDQRLLGDDAADYLGNPKAVIPVTLDQLPEGRSLASSVMQMHPQSVPGQFVQYVQHYLTQAMAATTQIYDMAPNGMSGTPNDTARAAMIADANANSIFGPLLAVKGETRQRIAEIVVELYREYFPIKRYFPLGGKYSAQQGIWLSGADLSRDIRFEVVRESELPQTSLTRQDKFLNFLQLFGGFAGYQAALQSSPDLVAELSRMWNVTTTAAGFDASEQLCRRRLDQIKTGYQTLAPSMGGQQMQEPVIDESGAMMPPVGVDPTALMEFIQPPISPLEKDHQGKASWVQTQLDTDEGLELPLEVRAAMELWIQLHFQYSGAQQMALAGQAAQVGIAGQPPMPPMVMGKAA